MEALLNGAKSYNKQKRGAAKAVPLKLYKVFAFSKELQKLYVLFAFIVGISFTKNPKAVSLILIKRQQLWMIFAIEIYDTAKNTAAAAFGSAAAGSLFVILVLWNVLHKMTK